jgi:hypothetical protein
MQVCFSAGATKILLPMEMVETAQQMGKLKFFPVVFDLKSDEWFDDIFTLIDFRKMIK